MKSDSGSMARARAMIASEIAAELVEPAATAERRPGVLYVHQSEYPGVLWADDRWPEWRVVVNVAGTRFVLQGKRRNGLWRDLLSAMGRAALVERLEMEGLPESMAQSVAAALPKYPKQAERPWADQDKERAEAERAAALVADPHSGEVARSERGRVVVADTVAGPVYSIQKPRGLGGWRSIRTVESRVEVLRTVHGKGQKRKGGAGIYCDELRKACEGLPEQAQRPENRPAGGPKGLAGRSARKSARNAP